MLVQQLHILLFCFFYLFLVAPLVENPSRFTIIRFIFSSRLTPFRCIKMNPLEEQLTSQDIHLLRSLLGQFRGQLNQATPSMPATPLVPSPPALPPVLSPAQPMSPAAPSTQSLPPLSVSNNSIQLQPPLPTLNNGMLQPRYPTFPPHPGHPSIAPVITPYHSALPGAQGHPPRSTRISSMVENIGSGITSQVNQQRLAAAAMNLPSHVSLPQRTARRRRRGLAISPPTLMPAFSINSVLSNEGLSPLIRIKVKVYPPQVSISLSFFLIHPNQLTWTGGAD
jgi:hypothetical protein